MNMEFAWTVRRLKDFLNECKLPDDAPVVLHRCYPIKTPIFCKLVDICHDELGKNTFAVARKPAIMALSISHVEGI